MASVGMGFAPTACPRSVGVSEPVAVSVGVMVGTAIIEICDDSIPIKEMMLASHQIIDEQGAFLARIYRKKVA
ncbi:MAG: hypothetical protein AB9891_18420 [Anaerolineaceae bacterium]